MMMLMLCVQRRKYEELREERDLATVRVLTPETETAAGGLWRLLWTIKRPRDPNGRELLILAVCGFGWG